MMTTGDGKTPYVTMPRVATLRDVADRAGVSISTASRALTRSRPVSEGLAERVLEAAQMLGYRANVGARNLRLSRTMTIGLIYERMDTPVYLDILKGLTAAADELGYSLIVSSAEGDADRYRSLLGRLYERRVDALLVASPRDVREELEPFVSAGVPAVALFSRGSDCRDIPLVFVPQEEALRDALRRLRTLGHERVVYLGSPTSLANRWRALEPAARAVGIEPTVQAIPDDLAFGELRSHLVALLDDERDATAVFAHGRHLGGLYAALEERGESIPEDRSVVTFTDSRLTVGLTDPPLASIRIDTVELGRRAIDTLEAWLGGTAPDNINELNLAEWCATPSVAVAPTR